MRIAIATMRARPGSFTEDEDLVVFLKDRGVDARLEVWDDSGVGWRRFDLVVIRSTWDYFHRRDDFLSWADEVGERLQNAPAVVRWNSDKRYLGDLADSGLRVVATSYVAPGEVPPALTGESVIKPTVSAGARDTGRFGPDQSDQARALVATIVASGRTAMVQPYYASVDARGEIAIVFIDGKPSHALRKRAVLRPREIAPIRDDALGAAEVMYDPELVRAAVATEAELKSARAVVEEITQRFGEPPLYARVDQVHDSDGMPVLLELEAIEPALYLAEAPGAAERFADAILARARRR